MQKIAQFTLPQLPGRGGAELTVETSVIRRAAEEFTIGVVNVERFHAVDYILLHVEDIPYLRRALDAVEEAFNPPPPDETLSAARGALRVQGITGIEYDDEEHLRSPREYCTSCGALWPCRTAVAYVAAAMRTKGGSS